MNYKPPKETENTTHIREYEHNESSKWFCHNSPDGYHHPQKKSTIPACTYCGKIT